MFPTLTYFDMTITVSLFRQGHQVMGTFMRADTDTTNISAKALNNTDYTGKHYQYNHN